MATKQPVGAVGLQAQHLWAPLLCSLLPVPSGTSESSRLCLLSFQALVLTMLQRLEQLVEAK